MVPTSTGEWRSLLGKPSKPAKKSKPTPKGKLGNMVKVLRGRGMRLRRTYKGTLYKARLRKNGKVQMKASAAGRAICGDHVNGWQFWNCERAPNDWVKLEKLRK